MAKCLYDLLITDHLFNQCCLFSSRLRLQLKHGIRLFCNKASHKQRNRCQKHNHYRNLNIDKEHKQQSTDDRCQTGKQLCESHQQTIRKRVHIRNDTADHVPMGMTVNIRQRQMFDPLKRIPSDITDNIVCHTVIAHIHNPLCRSRDANYNYAFFCNCKNPRKIHISFVQNQVNRPSGQNREIQSQCHCHRCQHNRQNQYGNIVFQIMHHFF